MKVLALIPARGGSKTIPRKNIHPLAGKSLIQRAFECATESGVVDRVMLSTDDQEIAEVARSFGLEVPFIRPSALAQDDTPMIDVAIHAIQSLGRVDYRPDALLLLQPPSPLRRPSHIRQAVSLLQDNDAVCSVSPVPKELCPHYLMRITSAGFLDYFMPNGASYTRRQDVPQAYRRDGAIFLTRTTVIQDQRSFYGHCCVPLVIPFAETINIDEPEDWEAAERKLSGTSL